jgi:hypothetical protein
MLIRDVEIDKVREVLTFVILVLIESKISNRYLILVMSMKVMFLAVIFEDVIWKRGEDEDLYMMFSITNKLPKLTLMKSLLLDWVVIFSNTTLMMFKIELAAKMQFSDRIFVMWESSKITVETNELTIILWSLILVELMNFKDP